MKEEKEQKLSELSEKELLEILKEGIAKDFQEYFRRKNERRRKR